MKAGTVLRVGSYYRVGSTWEGIGQRVMLCTEIKTGSHYDFPVILDNCYSFDTFGIYNPKHVPDPSNDILYECDKDGNEIVQKETVEIPVVQRPELSEETLWLTEFAKTCSEVVKKDLTACDLAAILHIYSSYK